jgi:hypothetical protein
VGPGPPTLLQWVIRAPGPCYFSQRPAKQLQSRGLCFSALGDGSCKTQVGSGPEELQTQSTLLPKPHPPRGFLDAFKRHLFLLGVLEARRAKSSPPSKWSSGKACRGSAEWAEPFQVTPGELTKKQARRSFWSPAKVTTPWSFWGPAKLTTPWSFWGPANVCDSMLGGGRGPCHHSLPSWGPQANKNPPHIPTTLWRTHQLKWGARPPTLVQLVIRVSGARGPPNQKGPCKPGCPRGSRPQDPHPHNIRKAHQFRWGLGPPPYSDGLSGPRGPAGSQTTKNPVNTDPPGAPDPKTPIPTTSGKPINSGGGGLHPAPYSNGSSGPRGRRAPRHKSPL